MKIINKINEILKDIDGNVIGIGFKDDILLDTINNNNKILSCNLLDSVSKGSGKGKLKKIKISKLRKKFKKKKTDYIICDIDKVNYFIKKFVSDSIYLNKKYVYIYQNNFNDLERVKVYYGRYSKDISTIKCEDGIILKIKTDSDTNKLKDILYRVLNLFSDINYFITELLLK